MGLLLAKADSMLDVAINFLFETTEKLNREYVFAWFHWYNRQRTRDKETGDNYSPFAVTCDN